MIGWTQATLQQVCSRITDGAHASPTSVPNGMPMASVKDLTRFGINIESCRHISRDDYDKLLRQGCRPQLDDVLIAKDGATALDTVCQVKREHDVVLLSSVAILRPNQEKVIPAFLRYYLDASSTRSYMKGAFISGAAIPRVVLQDFKRAEILLPPLPTQCKIAAVLSAYDDLIENNTRRIQILEEMAQALYREWFVHFRFPGHEKSGMLESEVVGLIPEGWSIVPFNKVCINYDRRRKPLSSIQRADIKGPYPYYGAAKIFDYINDFIFDGDYLLIAEDGSVITPDRKPILQMAHGKFWVNNHTHIIQGKPPISTEFLFLALSQVDISGYITGAAQPKITQENLNRIPIVLAPIAILYMFNDTVRPLFQQMFCLQRKQENLRQTRDLLLPKLISGEVDVVEL